jgi:hypothetical protein
MATVKGIRVGNYCTRVSTELSGMKTKLLGFVEEIESMDGPEKELVMKHIPHLRDMIQTIDWKLEIITRACPTAWEGRSDVESRVSVQLQDEPSETVAAGGYLGG